MMNFGHFWAPLPSPLTFHNVNNHGGKENCKGTKNKRKQRKQHKTNRNKTKKDTGGGTNKRVRVFFGENVTGRRPATFSQKHGLCPFRVFRVFRVLRVFRVFKVNDILEGQKGY